MDLASANLRVPLRNFIVTRDGTSAISTKLLAMKWPALFPVVDVLWDHLYKAVSAFRRRLPGDGRYTRRRLSTRTVGALATLRTGLLANGSPKAFRLAQLTGLRLRDVAAWQHWKLVGNPSPPPPWPQVVTWPWRRQA
jgi:hypothetical protein